jgi:hypothetical protein
VKKTYQGMKDKSKPKFEVLGKREMLVEVPLPMVEVWEELQAQVEQLTGQAGLRIIGTILENEVTRRVGPPYRPDPASGAVRWGRQPGYVVFGGRRESSAQRETLARRRTSLALDRHGLAGSAEEIPASERLSRTAAFASPDEPVVDSTGPGRVTCGKSRAAVLFQVSTKGGTISRRIHVLHDEAEIRRRPSQQD